MSKGLALLATMAVVAGLLIASPAAAEELAVKLHVHNALDQARSGEPVSGGVPLPHGAVKDPAALVLLDAAGQPVPAQFSAINRWGDDNSVMWLLVQSVASVPAKGETVFTLTTGQAAPARPQLKVNQGDDAVTLETGKIKLSISKKVGNFIDAAWLDANGDGQYGDDEQVIRGGSAGGSSFTLQADGGVYSSAAGAPREVVVEESGPERATVVIRGLHTPVTGNGKLPYLYGYLARVRVYAGQPTVRISYAITNGESPAIGSPVCSAAAIRLPLAGPADAKKSGGDRYVSAAVGKAAATLAVRYLSRNEPADLVADADNALMLQPFGQQPDHMEICARKTWEMQLTLLPAGQIESAAALAGQFDNALRFWCEPQWVDQTNAWGDFGTLSVPDAKGAERIRKQFKPYGPKGWRMLGCLPEMQSGSSSAPSGGYEPLISDGDYYLAYMQTGDRRYFDQIELTSWHWRDRRYIYIDTPFADKKWTGNGGVYNNYWKDAGKNYPDVQAEQFKRYGGSWNYGGPWGPMDTQHFSVDEVVNYYYLTGDRQCLDALSMYGQEAASFVNGFVKEGKTSVSRAHGWTTRALVSVYEATNDKQWLDLADKAVATIILNQDKTAGTISDVNATDKTGKLADHTPFMAAAVGMSLGRYYRHYPKEEVRDAILGIADWLCYDVAGAKVANPGFSYHWTKDAPAGRSASGHRCMSTMAWAYRSTGQPRYLEAADKHAGGKLDAWYTNGFGQEYVKIKQGERADSAAPAAVGDLSGKALGEGKVELAWTAPGDDGQSGRAAEYQVKFATMQIVERSDWRNRPDSEISFWAANNCPGEPKPAPAGAGEKFVVTGLAPGVYWFALKSYDEQPNQSDLSNVVKVEVK